MRGPGSLKFIAVDSSLVETWIDCILADDWLLNCNQFAIALSDSLDSTVYDVQEGLFVKLFYFGFNVWLNRLVVRMVIKSNWIDWPLLSAKICRASAIRNQVPTDVLIFDKTQFAKLCLIPICIFCGFSLMRKRVVGVGRWFKI